ncbi:hypothetical protein F5Y18DRAFT_426981 [Xylariaceae sp. FL1019]|nr:hypothetical protein F5Y18DRAFT_426981 [Xylariaceae sp. FL1019]
MLKSTPSVIASLVAMSVACTIPTGPALSNNITEGFSLQLQNASYPDIHNHYLNIWDWGGGDQHLFVSPAGNSTSELQLIDGVITLPWTPTLRAVINGEYEPLDNTTKMFMTDRGDPRAVWDVVYGCNPDTDELQVELKFKSRGDLENGGLMGVRPFNGMYDFRWKGPGTSVNDASRPWTHVTMVVVHNATTS